MALVYADRVKVRSRTTGTGTFTLENTAAGFQSFSIIGDGNETFYGIVDVAGNWEIGRGTYNAVGTTLSRDQIISSSNNNQLVDFPAGGKNVYTTIPSSLVAPLLGIETDPVFSTASLISADLKGSIFADNSTLMIDGIEGSVVGPVKNNITDIKISGGTSGDILSTDGAGNLTFVPPQSSNTGNVTFNGNAISSSDSSALSFVPQTGFNSNITVDGDIVLNGDNRIQANTGINLIPNLSAENFGSTLNIQGIPGGEGFPGVVISTQSSYIQIGSWIMFADGGLFSVPLSSTPDDPFSGKIYIADGVNWDPANYTSGTPYPVFYDGNDFLPMTPAPSP
jgi:hypothetical protein